MKNKQNIAIIGAGPVGCFMAILLAKRGFNVDIYERFSQDEMLQKASGRSFNVTFFRRGVEALKKADVFNPIKKYLIRLKGTVIHPIYSSSIFLKYNSQKTPYYAVRRAAVVETLLKNVQKYPNITVHFDISLLSIDRHKKTITLQHVQTKKISTISCSVVLGADGVNSQVRKIVLEGQSASFSQEYEEWKYKEIFISRDMVKKLKLVKDTMHVWSRENAMLASFPNPDSSFTAMLALPTFGYLQTHRDIQQFIEAHFPDLLPNLSQITKDILNNPEGRFVSIHVKPWYAGDFIGILGDAAHAALPFQGQGMTCGFEDCLEIASLIDQYGTDWQRIFPAYEANRKKHADVLVSTSQRSFGKIRRHIMADYEAIYDRADSLLHSLFPRFWHPPLYLMMSYYKQGFADIVAIHARQRKRATFLGISFAVYTLTELLKITIGTIDLYRRMQYNIKDFFRPINLSPIFGVRKYAQYAFFIISKLWAA